MSDAKEKQVPKLEVVLGIDLGTTNTCVAVMKNVRKNPQVEIIANDMGERTTPSYVAFTETEPLVGTAAKDQANSNPLNTIYEGKRLIGRKIDDPEVMKKIKLWPFKVVNNEENNNPIYEVQFKNAKKVLTPEQISAMILERIKERADEFLMDFKVTKAVITVPAYFSDSQRQATIDAGVIAGLEVMEIINEPTAAAIAYGYDKMFKKEKNVLVFDFGGGTLDVAIIGITNRDFNVKAVSGDKDLGGGDIDNMLLEHYVKDIREKNNVDLMKDPRALGMLRNCCEKAKCFLSTKLNYTLDIKNISDQLNFKKELSRARFEDICSDLLDQVVEPIETALNESGLSENDIDEVILVGGSSRIPAVQERVEEIFKNVEIKKTINPDEAIAHGAAIRAATLSDKSGDHRVNLMDVIPHSLGVTVRNTEMSFIIPRNTKIPVTKTVEYSTPVDNQTNVKIEILEGENKKSALNSKLGEFLLNGIEMAARGVPRIIVTLNVDSNGILTVSAQDVRAGRKNDLKIESLKGRLKQKEINEQTEGNKMFSKIRAKALANTKARNGLESFATKMKNGVTRKNKKKLIPEDSFVKINSACLEVLEWISDNPNSTEIECKKKFNELRDICTKNLPSEE